MKYFFKVISIYFGNSSDITNQPAGLGVAFLFCTRCSFRRNCLCLLVPLETNNTFLVILVLQILKSKYRSPPTTTITITYFSGL